MSPDFTDATIEKIIVHKIGNKYQEEDMVLSKHDIELKDELMYDLLSKYFLSPFKKSEEYFQFDHPTNIELNEVYHYAQTLFNSQLEFYNQSVNLAKLLYECTQHPNIKSGEFYVVYFSDCKVGGEYADAIGLFKSENKETFLKVYENSQENLEVDYTQGININKLDKGCLIFDQKKGEGYKICVVDTAKGSDDVAKYWKYHFLGIKPMEDQYYHTSNYLDMCKNFVTDVFNDENEVEKSDQLLMLDRSITYFKENDSFNVQNFENQVLETPEVIDAFREYKEDFSDKNEVPTYDEFDISDSAIKGQQKFFKSVIKLDKKFHVYVHGGHHLMEKGYDEDRKMKYYKLFYEKES